VCVERQEEMDRVLIYAVVSADGQCLYRKVFLATCVQTQAAYRMRTACPNTGSGHSQQPPGAYLDILEHACAELWVAACDDGNVLQHAAQGITRRLL
jgi:hypothetical protein